MNNKNTQNNDPVSDWAHNAMLAIQPYGESVDTGIGNGIGWGASAIQRAIQSLANPGKPPKPQIISPLAQGAIPQAARSMATSTQTPSVLQNIQSAMNPHVAGQVQAAETGPTATPKQEPQYDFSSFTTTPVPKQVAPIIYNSAKQNGVDPNVFASLLFSEHGFLTTPGYNYNTDGSYDRGIAQINSKAHPEVSDQQALDPNFAIPYAAKILGSHIKNLGIEKGIAAYNVGEGGAQDPETFNNQGKAYLNKITSGLSGALLKKLGLVKK